LISLSAFAAARGRVGLLQGGPRRGEPQGRESGERGVEPGDAGDSSGAGGAACAGRSRCCGRGRGVGTGTGWDAVRRGTFWPLAIRRVPGGVRGGRSRSRWGRAGGAWLCRSGPRPMTGGAGTSGGWKGAGSGGAARAGLKLWPWRGPGRCGHAVVEGSLSKNINTLYLNFLRYISHVIPITFQNLHLKNVSHVRLFSPQNTLILVKVD
jgi:hypothetical protein